MDGIAMGVGRVMGSSAAKRASTCHTILGHEQISLRYRNVAESEQKSPVSVQTAPSFIGELSVARPARGDARFAIE